MERQVITEDDIFNQDLKHVLASQLDIDSSYYKSLVMNCNPRNVTSYNIFLNGKCVKWTPILSVAIQLYNSI